MYQLPARILSYAILDITVLAKVLQRKLVEAIVPRDILLQGPYEDGADHGNQKNDNHCRVDEREPMDLRVVHVEVIVPSRRKGRRAQPPVHVVGERNLVLRVFIQNNCIVCAATLRFPVSHHLRVAQRVWVNQHTHHPVVVRARFMIVDHNVVVVVEFRAIVADLTQRESRTIKRFLGIGILQQLRRWQSVYQPVQVVALVHSLVHEYSILWVVCRLT
jgi:hypothetical protein